jgi:hypothetical protein
MPALPDRGAGGFDPVQPFGQCFPAHDGSAWGLYVEAAQLAVDKTCGPSIKIRYSVARVDASGKVAKAPSRNVTASACSVPIFGGTIGRAGTYDFDGDGTDEALLVAGQSEFRSTGWVRAEVLTFKGGSIQAYKPAPRGVLGMRDMDCDGRPDLLYDEPFSLDTVGCRGPVHSSMLGPTFVAHGLSGGTFSLDDPVAQHTEQGVAQQRPPSPDDADPDAWLLPYVRYARIHGTPSEALIEQVRKTCRPSKRSEARCTGPHPGVCFDHPTILNWARAKPPFTIH